MYQFFKRRHQTAEPETLAVCARFHMGISCKGDPPWTSATGNFWTSNCEGLILLGETTAECFLTVVAMFFAGMTLGGTLFAHESKPMRIASNSTAAVMVCDHNGACRIRSHPPAVAALVE
jgi:hypothetical protein